MKDEPASLRDCDAFPDGAVANTDGWKFNQPVSGATALAYTVAFLEIIGDTPRPRVFGISAAGVVQVDPAAPTKTLPLTDGVSGALTDDGVRVNTPAGWRLAGGALQISDGTGGGTFALTAVCPPATPSSPSSSTSSGPSTSASASPSASASTSTPTQAPAPSASSSSPGPTAGLPITGGRTTPLAVTGGVAVLAGLLLLLAVRRRRGTTRFQA